MILETNETTLFFFPDDPVPTAQEVKDHPDVFVIDPAYKNCRTRYNQLNYNLFYSRAAEKTLTHPAFLKFKKSGEAYLEVLRWIQSANFAAYLNNGDYLLLIDKSADYYYVKVWNTKTGQYLHDKSFGKSEFSSFFGCSEAPEAVFGWLDRLDSPAEYLPGVKAEYRLSVAESTGARLQTQEEYDCFLREAQIAFDEEDAEKAVRLVDKALSLSGYEASAEALKKRAAYGAGLHKTGILNLVPLKEELPDGKKKTYPKREILSEVPNAVAAIQKSLDEAIKGKIDGDVYSTPKTYISPGQCSEDGRFFLINTSMTDERDSDLNGDIEITDWYGAAVVNRFSDEIVYFDAELYKKDPFSYTTELDYDVELNHDGSKLLIHSITVSVVDLSRGEGSRYLLDIPCRSAHFMEDERFVLCFDRDDTVHVINAENGEELGRRKLGFSEDAAIIPVDNDCFIFKQEDEQSLGWIVWDYGELHGDKMNSVNPDKSETKDTKEDTASEKSVPSEPDDSVSSSFTPDGSQDDTSEAGIEEVKYQIKKGDVLLGDYEVLTDAIYGGMGKVWHVHQRSKNRDLAMKQPQLRGTEERKNRQKERFIKAHQNWIELGQCPDIVSCYEVTDIDGVPTAFSEWMEGGSLREKIRDGSMYEGHELWQRVVRIAIQIARGMEYVHSKKVIHCDIKPANILFTANGTVKINDFSLAVFKNSNISMPTGFTPQYCSKEQQEGLMPEPKTDIYSCALTILEILIGSRPWRTGPEVAEQPDKYIAQSRILIPDGMKDLLVRCLKGEVTDASSLRAELENMTIDRPSSSSTDKTELSTSSISNEIDKSIQEEFSFSQAAAYDAMLRKEKGQKPESISNEEIKKGDPILDTYKVLDDAIHGGMGSVWRVHHESWNTDLAMKHPQPRFFAEGSEARKEEFIKECENWINLGLHPNIVSCYYVREIGGVPTIFSEWMDNGSLKDRIKDGSLYEGTEEEVQERILDIAIQTARGLQYSHENNLIHQDVKPGNILLTKNWDAKVADFGLAKAQSQLTENKKPVSTGYTIQYCPKEQAEGAPAEKWMDVYAWALTVLEMYAGKRLWDTGAEAKEHFDEYRTQCKYAIPDSLQTLLRACLSDPANDFLSIVNAMTDEYKKTIGNDYPRPASKAAADTADSLNNRALSMLDLGMPEEAEKLWDAALRNDPGHVDAIFNRAIFRWTYGEGTDMHLLEDLRAIPDPAQREKLENLAAEMRGELQKGSKHGANCADKIEGTSNIFDLEAGNADYCPAPDCNGYVRTKKGKNYYNTAVTLLYRISQDGETCSLLDTYPEQYTTVHDGSVSRDGRYIVLNNSGAISLYDSKEAKLLWTRKFKQYSISSACAGIDDKNCYIGKEDGIYEFDVSSFSERRIYSGKDILAMKLDPDNMILLFREDAFTIKLLDLYSEKIIATAELESEPQWYELTQDGKSLLVGVGNVLEIYNLESGKRDRLFTFADADTDGKPRLCCISDSYALRYTSSYCSIWDMKKGICLRSIRFSGIIAARLTKIGNDGMIKGFIVTRYPASFNTFVISAESPKPHWQLCRIRKTAEQIYQDEAFYAAVEKTQQAVKQQNWEMARESLAKARSVESRKNDPVCLQLYDTLYPHFRRGRLLQYIPVQTIGEKVAMRGTIAFSDDGSFLLAGTNQGRVVYDVRSGKQILLVQECKDIKFVHEGTCVAAIQRESEEKARLLIYALQSADSPGNSKPEAKLLGSYPMKYGLHPYIEEAEGTIYARSQSFLGNRVDAAADAVSGEFLHTRKKPRAEKPDSILKAAKKDGMQYVSYGLTRMALDNGVTAFCCRDWIEAEKRYIDNLWIYDAQGKQLCKADFSELELKNIKPLTDGLISAERGDKLYLIEAKNYLECDNPMGYELAVEQKFGGMRSEGYDGKYKAVKGEYWGITISRDCRFLFLSGTVYRLEWELDL